MWFGRTASWARITLAAAAAFAGAPPSEAVAEWVSPQPIATFPRAVFFIGLSFGDTDHDGQYEAVFSGRNLADQCCYYQIYEHRGIDEYELAFMGAFLDVLGTDDLDQDGRSEVIGQYGDILQVYEAVDGNSHPSELVWSAPIFSTTVGRVAFGDSDRDGRRELMFAAGSTLRIFECVGDNAFVQHLIATGAGGGINDILIADLDMDGFIEIAVTKGTGNLLKIYESHSDDTWKETFVASGILEANRMQGGYDVDGNGKPDLLIGCRGSDVQAFQYRTEVYESVGNDRFQRTAAFEVSDGSGGSPATALGDLDGLGVPEYVMRTGTRVWVFQVTGPGGWILVDEVEWPGTGGHSGVRIFDLNQNGRDELVWVSVSWDTPTYVLEVRSGTSDVQVPGADSPRMRLTVTPNPVRGDAYLSLAGWAGQSTIARVIDARGRVVHVQPFAPDATGRGLLRFEHLHAGVYFVRIETADRIPIAAGRAVVAPR